MSSLAPTNMLPMTSIEAIVPRTSRGVLTATLRARGVEIVVTDGDRAGSIATSMVAADDEVEAVTEAIREVVARTDRSMPRIAVRRPRSA